MSSKFRGIFEGGKGREPGNAEADRPLSPSEIASLSGGVDAPMPGVVSSPNNVVAGARVVGPVPPANLQASSTPIRTPPPFPPPRPLSALPPALPAKGPGRPKGKRSDPSFEQVTAYVPRELYGKVRGVLWNHHDRKEFSELLAELLAAWLKDQPSG